VETLIYQQSGLLGVSGISSDMRTLLASSDPRAAEAIDLFVYRIGRELGSLAAALGGLDALVFTGGIGENAAAIRARVCRDAAWLGLELDESANAGRGPRISRPESRVTAWVIPTNEELMIAQHTRRLLAGADDRPAHPAPARRQGPLKEEPMTTLGQSSLLLPGESELNLLRKRWGWLLALGIVLSVLGVLAIGTSLSGIATLTTILFFGILLLVAAGVQLATAILARTWRGVFLHLLVGILYLVVGALMIERPDRAARALTLMIAAAFLVGGLFRIVFSLSADRFPGWSWVLGNGVVTVAMGILIWRRWPSSAVWVIGLFVGIELFCAGAAWVTLALGLRDKAKPSA
jgi:uncharacterized membrane protein HdeD (DUF308 family)